MSNDKKPDYKALALEILRLSNTLSEKLLIVDGTAKAVVMEPNWHALYEEAMRKNAQLSCEIDVLRTERDRLKSFLQSKQVARDVELDGLDLSVRSANLFYSLGLVTLGDLAKFGEKNLAKQKNAGRKTIIEAKKLLESHGLAFEEET